MKILVAIANYGTQNDRYLHQLLAEYRSMPFEVDIIVLSNLSKDLGPGVEVKVGLPTKDPWSLPFSHKKLFADRRSNYDLFIYSEDDMLLTERNIRAFLAATEILKKNEIAGFLRTEVGKGGEQYFCDAFDHWHWDPGSVRTRGDRTFAFFSNEHSAFYVLTKAQLKHAIDSGGFLTGPREGRYDLLCTAATDPYTQCGFKKLICISHLDDFLVHHLSNKYVETLSLEGSQFRRQIAALMAISRNGRPHGELLETETKLPSLKWSKNYYESCNPGIVDLIPAGAKSVLSVGCGWGAVEECLAKKGIRVVAIPLDSVISACAEARGVEIVPGSFKSAIEKLAGQQFDCLLVSNILHLVKDPVAVLSSFADAIPGDFRVIATVPNLSKLPVVLGRIRRDKRFTNLGKYERTGVHITSRGIIRKWFKSAGLKVEYMKDVMSPKVRTARRLTLGLADALLASEFVVVGKKT